MDGEERSALVPSPARGLLPWGGGGPVSSPPWSGHYLQRTHRLETMQWIIIPHMNCSNDIAVRRFESGKEENNLAILFFFIVYKSLKVKWTCQSQACFHTLDSVKSFVGERAKIAIEYLFISTRPPQLNASIVIYPTSVSLTTADSRRTPPRKPTKSHQLNFNTRPVQFE